MGNTIQESTVIIAMVLEVRFQWGTILARLAQSEPLGLVFQDVWTQKSNLTSDLDQQMSPSLAM